MTPKFLSRFFSLAIAALVSLAAASSTVAQTTVTPADPTVDNGTHAYGSYDGIHDNISMSSGNLSFCIPLVSLKGPNKHDLDVPLCYNSQFMQGYSSGSAAGAAPSVPYFPWVWASNTPSGYTTPIMGPGWTFSGAPAYYAAPKTSPNGQPVVFMPDGATYTINGNAGPDNENADLYSNGSGTYWMKDGTRFVQTGTGGSCPSVGCFEELFTDGSTMTWNNTSVTDSIGRSVTVQTTGAGFSSSTMQSSTANMVVSYENSGGTPTNVEVMMQTMSFTCSNNAAEAGIVSGLSFSMPTAVILANGLTYTFQYDSCGALIKVTYPTGGYTRYAYGTMQAVVEILPSGNTYTYYQNEVVAKYVCPSASTPYRATSAPSGNTCSVSEETTTYTPTSSASTNGSANTQNIVVDPVGNKTVYQFALPNANAGLAALETSRQYYDASGKLWKTVTTQYANTATPGSNLNGEVGGWPALPTIQTTTLDNGMVSQTQWSYDLQQVYTNDSVMIEERVYDYASGGPGALLKRTDYTWLHRVDPDDYGWPGGIGTEGQIRAHICDRKASETVYDGNGKMLSQMQYAYDNASPSTYGAKGLLTSGSKWRSVDGATLTTTYSYSGNACCGNVTSMTDPKGNVTQYSYADNYADGVNRSSYAFLTKTTDPLGHVTQNQYYWETGLVSATCGNNFSGTCKTGLTSGADYTSYSYDEMGRKISTTAGDGGQTTTCYSEQGGTTGQSTCSPGAFPLQVTSTKLIVGSTTETSVATLDGEGKTTRSALLSDPNCSGGTVNTDTTYDADERKSTVTNPYCSTNQGAPTSGTTTYAYDGLSRVTQITHPDGTTATNTYTGRAVLSADEGNGTDKIQRISQTDTLGRLISVCEVTAETQQGSNNAPSSCGLDMSGSGFLTTYAYDASSSNGPLDGLTSVVQGGMSRSFVYDSLGELRSASNPESGTTNYSYDLNGNLTSKTDAKGITTTYAYDALNRLTSKSYSDGVTPSACYEYDQNASGNGIGRLATEWTQAGTCPAAPPSSGVLTQRTFAAYDLLGRIATDEQCATLNNCGAGVYTLNYGYDLAGDVASFNNGLAGNSALSFTGQFNSAGRLSTLNGSASPGGQSTPLFTATGYTPSGALSNAMIGTGSVQGITFQRNYNSRLLPTAETDTVATTPGTATAQISGSEQIYAYSSGSFTFSGTEQCSGSTCDAGQFLVTIGTGQPALLSYGQNSTPATLASNLASIISCSNNSVQAAANGATVSLQSCAAGTNNDYAISAIPDGHSSSFSSYSFSVASSGSPMTPIINATTLGSAGTAATFITTGSGQVTTGLFQFFVYPSGGHSFVFSGTLSWSATDTTSTLAARLATAIGSCSGSGAVVGALADGPSIYLVSCQAGTSYIFEYGLDYSNGSAGFQVSMTNTPASSEVPSITFSGTEESGQTGTLLVTIATVGYQGAPQQVGVSWTSTSTPNTLASALASGLGTCSANVNGMVGVASGATVYLGACSASATNTISAGVIGCSCSSSNPADFAAVVTTEPPSGQLPPVPGATYDSGTVTLTVNGTQIASTTYGSESTPESIASALSSAASGNSLVTVTVSGDSLTMTADGDGTITDYSYQINASSSNPATFASASFAGSPSSAALTGGANVALYNWAINSYAPNGDALSMTDSVMGTWSYAYDDFNRLTSGAASAGVDNGLTLGWTYDRYGNRWAQNATGSGNVSAVQPQLSFGNSNQVSGWSYDADGNLLNDGRNTYTYDAEGRIITLNGASTYLYDAEGRRVAKYSGAAISASYLLDLGGHQVTELNSAGTWMHSNVWAPGGRLVATYEGPGESKPNTWHFHLTDWLSTQRMQTTASGSQEEVCYSYPFGDGLDCTGTDATEHHFTGKERDVESGLDYFYARYFSSDLARFMSPDWAAAPTAVPYATFGDPQTLNLYAYVNNNPNTGIDLDGHAGVQGWSGGGGSDDTAGLLDGTTNYDPTNPFSNAAAPNGNSGTTTSVSNASGDTSDTSKATGDGPKPQQPAPTDPVQKQVQPGATTTTTTTATTTTTTTTTTATPQNGNGTTTAPAATPTTCEQAANTAAAVMGDVKPSKGDVVTAAVGAVVGAAAAASSAPEDGPAAPLVYKAGAALGGAAVGFLKDVITRGAIKLAIWGQTFSACMNPQGAMSPGIFAP